MKRMHFGQILATLVLGAFSQAHAATVNVDFTISNGGSGAYSGTAASPDAGTFWNSLVVGGHGVTSNGSLTSPVLVASDATTPTPFTVTIAKTSGGGTGYGSYDAGNDGQISGIAPGLMNDFVYVDGDQFLTFTIAHLVPGGSYDLYLYSQNGGYNSEKTNFIVGGVTKTATNGAGNASSFVENGNYVKFLGVVADGSGNISGTQDWAGAPNSSFDGFQISGPVPEPASTVALGMGGMALFLKRRRA